MHPQSWHDKKLTAEEEEEHYRLCEEYLRAMRQEGLWVVRCMKSSVAKAETHALQVSSLFEDMDPDGIVLLPVQQHRQYVAKRPDLQWRDADRVRRLLEAKTSVPQYSSFDAMARTLRFMAE